MNSLIESLNAWGNTFLDFAGSMLWQSSLLIAVVFGFDLLLRRKIRPAVRYTLWFVVFIKLILPPTLALPTGAAWWLRTHKTQAATPQSKVLVVSYSEPATAFVAPTVVKAPVAPPQPKLSRAAWILLVSAVVSSFLFAWLLFRWRQIAQCVRNTNEPSEALNKLLGEARLKAGIRKDVTLRLTSRAMSPAVCGLFRPVILLPQSLVEKLSAKQLRAVLLHELIHLRRQDVWVNCTQTLLQIFYWWHPLLWLANARVRRVREEAVDDAVMIALNEDAEIYAPTLLEVAKLAFGRPLASLGLVGILESRNALRQRIERLLNFTTPRRSGLSVVSILGIAALTALAVPMGEGPGGAAPSGQPVTEHLPQSRSDTRLPAASTIPGTHPAQLVLPNPYAQTSAVHTSPLRQKIYKKLNDIVFDNISYSGLTLAEVVRSLETETQRRDPEQEGVHFIVSKTSPRNLTQPDPLTGTPIVPNRTEALDPSTVKINLGHELKNVRLMDVLEVVVKSSDWPIKYSIMDYGIEFSFRGPEMPELFTRTFQVDSNALYQRLQQFGPGSTDIQSLAANFFTVAGISMDPPKSAFFNDRQGTLTVHATAADLDLTERLLDQKTGTEPAILLQDGKTLFQLGKLSEAEAKFRQVLQLEAANQRALYYLSQIEQAQAKESAEVQSQTPPVVPTNLYTRTFRVDTKTLEQEFKKSSAFHEGMNLQTAAVNFLQSIHVNMQPLRSVFFNERQGTLTVRATESDLDLVEAVINTLNIKPPEVSVKVRFVETDTANGGLNAMLKSVLTNKVSGSGDEPIFSTGILTASQFKPVLQVIQKNDRAKLLNEGEITMLSGRQGKLQILDIQTVVSDFKTTVTTNGTVWGYETTNMPFGTTLDLVPTVLPDGSTILMTVTPRVTEFLGYDDPKIFSKYDENLKHGQLPLPKYRVRQATTAVDIHDGQTIVIGILSDELVVKGVKGSELRRPFGNVKKKQLIVFISPIITDPSGNVIHSKDYYDGAIW